MNAYVVDASVAAKWFLPSRGETLVNEALELYREYVAGNVHLTAPDLFWPELGNVLWKAVRQKRVTRSSAEESIIALEKARISTFPSAPLLKEAFAIASTFDQTVYDGTYVALAVASDTLFVTADERLANALGAQFPVRWLGGLWRHR